MIAKKCKAKKDSAPKSKGLHVRDLTDYITNAHEDEKVLHTGAANFLADDYETQQIEMMALATQAVRSPNPSDHWVLSWAEGEQPTAAQADQAARRFLEHLGMAENQAMWALHGDTHNVHMHVVFNRVHPETGRVLKVNGGWDIRAGHQAAALIAHEQGWRVERGALYQVELGADGRAAAVARERGREPEQAAAIAVPARAPEAPSPPPPPEHRQPSTRARDMEARTGTKSAERIAAEQAAPIIRAAKSWQELHEWLAARGMRLERKASGAILWIDETPVKASQAGRDCAFGALTKRLGEFEPAPERSPDRPPPAAAERAPEPVVPMNPKVGWHEFAEARRKYYEAKYKAQDELRERVKKEWGELGRKHREYRRRLMGGSWKGKGEILNALRSRTAAMQAAEKAELRERQTRERQQVRKQFQYFPDFERWLRAERSQQHGDAWRYRHDLKNVAPVAQISNGSRDERAVGEREVAAAPRDIRDFNGKANGWAVEYRQRSDGRAATSVAFVDRGKIVDILTHDRAAVLAALQLSTEKWKQGIVVSGNDTFKSICVELAVEHRLNITNPELQKAIAEEQQRQQKERRPPPPPTLAELLELPTRENPEDYQPPKERAVEGVGRRGADEKATAPPAREGQREAGRAPTMPAAAPGSPPVTTPVRSPAEAYRRHWEDLTAKTASGGRVDLSRIDAEVAVRMRMTGYTQPVIERTVRDAAQARTNEKREWDAYAQRTASFAFGFAGSRSAAELAHGKERLFQLEGRDMQRELLMQREQQREALAVERGPHRGLEQDRARLEHERDRGLGRGHGRGGRGD